jgi:hypothetical protein
MCLACSGSNSTSIAGADAGADTSAAACPLGTNTTVVSTNAGCSLLSRDASSCKAARQAAGLSGFWLSFSCRVSLTSDGTYVTVKADSQPDYASSYFNGTACHIDPTGTPNPNHLIPQAITMIVPLSPTDATQNMTLGVVGVAANGVAIFDNQAAPGDDIYSEVATFDPCQGHPTPTNIYHYHTEPYALTYDDSRFVGVLRDGIPVYGRRDIDNTIPPLDVSGGHTGPTPDSTTPVYHYHVNQQTSTNPKSSGQSAWFITTGNYHGQAGGCTGCN